MNVNGIIQKNANEEIDKLQESKQLEFPFYQDFKNKCWEPIRAISADLVQRLLNAVGHDVRFDETRFAYWDLHTERFMKYCKADNIVWTKNVRGSPTDYYKEMAFVVWESHEAFLMFQMMVRPIPEDYIRSFNPDDEWPLELTDEITNPRCKRDDD